MVLGNGSLVARQRDTVRTVGCDRGMNRPTFDAVSDFIDRANRFWTMPGALDVTTSHGEIS